MRVQLAYVNKKRASHKETLFKTGGEERTRTADLLTASQKNNLLILYKIY